jgi:hypothetical protein
VRQMPSLGLASAGDGGELARGKLYFGDPPQTCDSLTLVVRLVAIYLGLVLIELYPADDCFTGFVVPKLLVHAEIEVCLVALNSSPHAYRTIVTHHYN